MVKVVGKLVVAAAVILAAYVWHETYRKEHRLPPEPLNNYQFVDQTEFHRGSTGLVEINGSWVRKGDLGDGSMLADKINDTKIECDRDRGECLEAQAVIIKGGKFMASRQLRHKIDSWEDNVITYRELLTCGEETYTIDLKAKTATGSGHWVKPPPGSGCGALGEVGDTGEKSWSYELVDGGKVYKDFLAKYR